MSHLGELAVLRNKKIVFFCTGKRQLNNNGWPSLSRKLNKHLFKPHDVCFAPNNHLVVSDIEDKPVKIFTLEGDQEQLNRFVIGYNNATRSLIVQDVNAVKKELSLRIQLNSELNSSSFSQYWLESPESLIPANCHMRY